MAASIYVCANGCVAPCISPLRGLVRFACVALLASAAYAPQFAGAQSFCASCRVQLGIGGTYHFWGQTGGVVIPVTVTWRDSRYELGVFRFATPQYLTEGGRQGPLPLMADADSSTAAAQRPRLTDHGPLRRLMADPYWGLSASRRWRLFEHGPVEGFFGFGLALRTESDVLSASRWDFASQFVLRVHLAGGRPAELAIRHWSNGGCKLPNHGQDFLTLTVLLN
jgi:Lipid A 3-O-deacylase (PagL)